MIGQQKTDGRISGHAEYVISGGFLLGKMTGIERYAVNLVMELDPIVLPGKIRLLVPETVKAEEWILQLKNIEVVRFGKRSRYFWEQIDLVGYLRRTNAKGIFLTNSVPLIYGVGIVVLHDISMKVNAKLFGKRARDIVSMFCWRIIYRRIMNSRMKIITVSEFSKSEIIRVYRIDPERITVAESAWQHMEKIESDENVLSRFHLTDGEYYFSIGGVAPNKNPKWTKMAAAQHPDRLFVVSGSAKGLKKNETLPENLLYTGYLSDREIKALMEHCRAFLFPSFYEGFGLPPLEALSVGAPAVLVSDIPVLHEIYSDAAFYISPWETERILLPGDKPEQKTVKDILGRYSWKQTAKKVTALLFGENNSDGDKLEHFS